MSDCTNFFSEFEAWRYFSGVEEFGVVPHLSQGACTAKDSGHNVVPTAVSQQKNARGKMKTPQKNRVKEKKKKAQKSTKLSKGAINKRNERFIHGELKHGLGT